MADTIRGRKETLGEISMGKLFSLDSPVMQFLSKMADLMILNLLTIVCCIPVITGGAAITAMYYMTLKIAKGEDCYIVKGYFKSFKENFRQATVIWLMVLVLSAILIGDLLILNYTDMAANKVMFVLVILIAVIALFTATYVFPVLSRFENTIKNTIKNSLLMSIMNLPRTVLILFFNLISPFLLFVTVEYLPAWFLIGISVPAYLCSLQFVKIFKKYEPEEGTEGESDEYVPLSFMVEEQEAKQRALEEAAGAEAASETEAE